MTAKTGVTHMGVFVNEENVHVSETINDLHIEFDVEDVEDVESPFPNSKQDGKTIHFSGQTIPANTFAKIKFKREDGEFEVVSWYWTHDDNPEDEKEGKRMGEVKKGPPKNSKGQITWK